MLSFQQGNHVPLGVKEGDTVLLPEYGGTKVIHFYFFFLFTLSNTSLYSFDLSQTLRKY